MGVCKYFHKHDSAVNVVLSFFCTAFLQILTMGIVMNWEQVEGNWKQFKGKMKEAWGDLTDDELDQVAGNREQLEGKIQEKYGKSKEEAKQEVDDLIEKW